MFIFVIVKMNLVKRNICDLKMCTIYTCVGGRCDDKICVNELKKLKVQNQEIDAIGKRKVD